MDHQDDKNRMQQFIPITYDRRQTLKAWVISSASAPKSAVVFHHMFQIARSEGAKQLGLPEDQVTCERNEEYDRFVEYGRVPPRQMLADGYWFDCQHCGTRIEADNPDTPLSSVVIEIDGEVFCREECSVAHEPVRQQRNQRFEAFKKRLQQRFPRLKFINFSGGYPHQYDRAQFEFPGGMFPGAVAEFEEGLRWCISEIDVEAWHEYTERSTKAAS